MRKQIIKMPVHVINQAVQIVNEVKSKYEEINEEIRNLPKIDVRRQGTDAIDKRAELIADYEARKLTISEEAEKKLKALADQYGKEIDDQIFPAAADISGDHAADYMLLHDGLVANVDQLRRIAEAHQTPAFMTAVEQYANRMGWNEDNEFGYVNAEKSVREVGKTMLDQCVSAVYRPSGFIAAMVTTDGELARRVQVEKCVDEYAAGTY